MSLCKGNKVFPNTLSLNLCCTVTAALFCHLYSEDREDAYLQSGAELWKCAAQQTQCIYRKCLCMW